MSLRFLNFASKCFRLQKSSVSCAGLWGPPAHQHPDIAATLGQAEKRYLGQVNLSGPAVFISLSWKEGGLSNTLSPEVLNQLGILLEREFVFPSFDLCAAHRIDHVTGVTLLSA